MRGYEGSPIVPALRAAGFDPATVDVVAMSHLHYDHAGGLLHADGSRAFPRAADRRPAPGVGGRAGDELAARRPRTTSRSCGSSRTGARRAGPRATASCCRACRSCGPAATRRATRRSSCAAPGRRRSAFFGDLAMRPWCANPRWVTAFDDFPLDSRRGQGRAVPRAPRSRTGLDRPAQPRAPDAGRAAGPGPRPLPVRGPLARHHARAADGGRGPLVEVATV